MSIQIESSDELEQLRARLRKMSDDELMRFGKAPRSLCRDPRCPDTFKRQLEEARGSRHFVRFHGGSVGKMENAAGACLDVGRKRLD